MPKRSPIASYLQRNPEFFERHQAVLARLKLPHARGGSTISLVERQIEVLREKQAALEDKLAELVRVARANDAIAERLHRFTRRLLRAVPRGRGHRAHRGGPARGFRCVPRRAGADRRAHRIRRCLRSCAPWRPKMRSLKSFESLFASGKPRCGQARDSQREFLFGPEGLEMGSVALVPLGDKGALGLLALGSADRDRFHPGMSTEFLARLADLIARRTEQPRPALSAPGLSRACSRPRSSGWRASGATSTPSGASRRTPTSSYARDLAALVKFCDRAGLVDWRALDSQHIAPFAARSHAGGLWRRAASSGASRRCAASIEFLLREAQARGRAGAPRRRA